MTRTDDQRIADIVAACDEPDAIVTLRREGGVDAQVLLRAAERLLEIVGEAASNVSESAMAAHPDVDWRSIARLRIALAHHYHRTDPDLIWSYATVEAPAVASSSRS